jgi:REP element-mobilizing transposase RayT
MPPPEPALDKPHAGQNYGALRGWYSRAYLPHYNNPGTIQSVTFRLADSMPQSKIHEIEEQLANHSPENIDTERRKKMEAWLDTGMGCCALRHPAVAALVQETLLKWDGDRYRLFAWCIMPNHVHALIQTIAPLSRIIQSWKSFTGRWINQKHTALRLAIPGTALWFREYWDRYIRDQNHFDRARAYIERNPVSAGLCKQPSDWPWSSATLPALEH